MKGYELAPPTEEKWPFNPCDAGEDSDEFDEVDGCLHGVPWCEDCPFCDDDATGIDGYW